MAEVNLTGKSLPERVMAVRDSLSPSERRVAQYMESMPTAELVFANAEKLGRLSRSSDATVVRTAQKLGYAGLPGLKREVGAVLSASQHPAERLSRQLSALGEDIDRLRATVFDDAVEALQLTMGSLSDEALQRAISALAQARDIHAFGYGNSEAGARHLARTAVRMGFRATASDSTGLMLADSLLKIRHGDAVVVFQPGRRLRELDVLFEHVASVGATSILVGGEDLMADVADVVDIGLTVMHGTTRIAAESVPMLATASVLTFGLSLVQEERSLQNRELFTHLRQRITGMPRT